MSESKAAIAGVFGRTAPTYDTIIPFFATLAEALVDAAQPEAGEEALDVACGRGAVLFHLAERVGSGGGVVGVDIAQEMVDETGAEISRRQLTWVDVQQMDAEQLAFLDGRFDLVTCGFGVFFFPDPVKALTEVRRVLRPGGRFVATTFGNGGYPWVAEVAKAVGVASATSPSPVGRADGLARVMGEAGFTPEPPVTVERAFVFRDVDAYIAWLWTQGTRRILEGLSPAEMSQFRQLSATHLEAHRVDDGFEYRAIADITIAR